MIGCLEFRGFGFLILIIYLSTALRKEYAISVLLYECA